MNKRSRRQRNRRQVKRTVLVVCEGERTERNYFDGLKRLDDVKKHYTVRVIPGKGGSRLQIVKHAVTKQKQFGSDECWCVIDTERLNNPETRNDFAQAKKLADQNNVNLAISNPSFEVWLLAHLERTCRSFRDGDAAGAYLDTRFQQILRRDYAKNDKKLFEYLKQHICDALSNSQMVRDHDHGDNTQVEECNSSTTVGELVNRLLADRLLRGDAWARKAR